eukprot:6185580-Pleurochrysis_carterae.AAC.4
MGPTLARARVPRSGRHNLVDVGAHVQLAQVNAATTSNGLTEKLQLLPRTHVLPRPRSILCVRLRPLLCQTQTRHTKKHREARGVCCEGWRIQPCMRAVRSCGLDRAGARHTGWPNKMIESTTDKNCRTVCEYTRVRCSR